MALLVKDADEITTWQELIRTYYPHSIEGILKNFLHCWLSNAQLAHYQVLLLNPPCISYAPSSTFSLTNPLPDSGPQNGQGCNCQYLHRPPLCLCSYAWTYLQGEKATHGRGKTHQKHGEILALLEAIWLPLRVAIIHCPRHQKGAGKRAKGNRMTDRVSRKLY